jgi:hypothetical protein
MAGIGNYKKDGKFTLRSGNSPLFKAMGATSPIKQEDDEENVIRATERSKEIQEGIEGMSDEEKKEILHRNIEALPYGRMEEGQEYREEMPDWMHNIAIRSDSARAVIHDFHEDMIREQEENDPK